MRIGLPLVLALLCACQSTPAPDPGAGAGGLPRGELFHLRPDWRSMSPAAFDQWMVDELPGGSARPLDKPDMRALTQALDEADLDSVRAAVILGRTLYPTSAALLIRRLERRVQGPERFSDCGDSVAAAALARFPDPRRYAQRLVPLAVGPHPHPDLEARVECAATALHAGYEEVIPFLLQVLRIDTFAGRADARDFYVSPTTAWARGRAAEALSQYAGVPLAYRFDGPIAAREAEARRLEELLLLSPAVRSPEAPAAASR